MSELLFKGVFARYASPDACDYYWKKLYKAYSSRRRYYHNLNHLERLYAYLNPVKKDIEDWEVLQMTLFFHDYVYNPLRKDNELKSATYAVKALNETTMNSDRIMRCHKQIVGTKDHEFSSDNDTNFFNDADMAVLGSSKEHYLAYTAGVRKEYGMYPDLMYNAGRKKVLKGFLEMPRIYKTAYFYDKFESTARENLIEELRKYS